MEKKGPPGCLGYMPGIIHVTTQLCMGDCFFLYKKHDIRIISPSTKNQDSMESKSIFFHGSHDFEGFNFQPSVICPGAAIRISSTRRKNAEGGKGLEGWITFHVGLKIWVFP